MLESGLAAHIHLNVSAALDEDIGTLSPALSRRTPPLLNPFPQQGEGTNEKGNLQSLRERGTENRDAVISNGDLTAQLIPEHTQAQATVVTRQQMVLCGTLWFEECFLRLDPDCKVHWSAREGELVQPGRQLCEV